MAKADLKNKKSTDVPASSSGSAVVRFGALVAVIAAAALVFMPQEYTDKISAKITAFNSKAPISNSDLQIGQERGSSCEVSQYLTEWSMEVPGFHIICVSQEDSALSVTMYMNGVDNKETFSSTQQTLEVDLQKHFPSRNVPQYAKGGRQPWSVYTTGGFRLWSAGTADVLPVVAAGVSFVFEGGVWIPPGVKVGHRQTLHNVSYTSDSKVELETLSMRPLVFLVEGFLHEEECDMIREISAPHVKSSSVSLMDKDKGKKATQWRTSSTYWLRSGSDKPWLQQIDQRVADLTRMPISHQEDVQVLRYELSQKYDIHHDYFDPSAYKGDPNTMRMTKHGAKNRLTTVFWYMSTVEKGGHTYFPRAGNMPHPPNNLCPPHDSKHQGLKVPSVKGNVIMFYNLLPSGGLDPLSTHGGCPVETGTKWSGNKWVWNEPRNG